MALPVILLTIRPLFWWTYSSISRVRSLLCFEGSQICPRNMDELSIWIHVEAEHSNAQSLTFVTQLGTSTSRTNVQYAMHRISTKRVTCEMSM